MRELRLVWPSRAERWRRPAIVALSVSLHALLLGYVGFKSFEPPGPYGGDVIDDPMFPRPPIHLQVGCATL